MPANRKPASKVAPIPTLPLPQYLSAQGVLACLLISSIVFLPRSKLFSISPVTLTSRDRPEPAWLRSLTSDPVKTVLWDVIGVSACMLWWAPSLRSWWNPTKSSDKEQRVRETLHRMAGATIATVTVSTLLTLMLVMLGASLQDHFLRTSLFSLHLAILGVWPVVYALGNSVLINPQSATRYTAARIFAHGQCETSLERALAYPVFGLLAGAGLGCVAFPLDWDRPWQTYPLPPLFGSTIGYIAGGIACWVQSGLREP